MSFTAPDILKSLNRTSGDFGSNGLNTGAKASIAPQNGFSQLMKRRSDLASAGASAVGDGEIQRQAEAEKAAGDLVSNALILPILKQIRRSPWGENTVFSRGIGEKTFGPQFDMQISDRIAHSPRLGVKAALTERLIKRGQSNVASKSTNLTNRPANARLDTHG